MMGGNSHPQGFTIGKVSWPFDIGFNIYALYGNTQRWELYLAWKYDRKKTILLVLALNFQILHSYHESASLTALKACNAMNRSEVQPSPFTYWLNHWLFVCTLSTPMQNHNAIDQYQRIFTIFTVKHYGRSFVNSGWFWAYYSILTRFMIHWTSYRVWRQ